MKEWENELGGIVRKDTSGKECVYIQDFGIGGGNWGTGLWRTGNGGAEVNGERK